MISNFAAFAGVSAIVIVTPGPDTALTIRNALLGGCRGGLLTAAGFASGQASWALLTSILPQFSAHGSFSALLLLGLAFSVMTLGWLAGYALIVARVGDFLRRGRVRRRLDAVTGVVLVAFGIRLITEYR